MDGRGPRSRAGRGAIGQARIQLSRCTEATMSGSQKLYGGDDDFLDEAATAETDQGGDDGDYEEICSDEVDRIVQSLEELMTGVESENIRAYLEEAADNIFALV